MMHLYDSAVPSGNAYKVHLLLSQLDEDYQTTSLDILSDPPETRSHSFLAKNPNGRIPLLELDDGRCLPESNAILAYLAEDTEYLPKDRFERGEVLSWLFFEQYSHEPYVAVLKFWTYWGGLENLSEERTQLARERGQQVLDVMAGHLASRDFFVADRYSIADIALFAYTQSAEAVGYDVAPSVEAWLNRVASLPGYVPIKADPRGKTPRGRLPEP